MSRRQPPSPAHPLATLRGACGPRPGLKTLATKPELWEPGRRCVSLAVMAEEAKARFRVGQIIRHKLFDYRGVIVDVDPVFSGTEEWYEMMAKSRPPKDKPWYHVLVHNASHTTYVAERNLEADESAQPVNHHLVDEIFSGMENGVYVARQSVN